MFEQPTTDLTPPPEWSDDAVGDAVVSLTGQVSAGQCQQLCWIADFEARMGWEGTAETASFLGYRCGMAPRAARELVALARRLPGFPAITRAFSEGRLCLTQVQAIVRIATPEIEDELIHLARVSTGPMLQRAVAKYRFLLDNLSEEAHNQAACAGRDARRLSYSFDDLGYFHLNGTFCTEAGAVIEAALNQVAAEARREAAGLAGADSPAEGAERPWEARQADALVAICEGVRHQELSARPGAARAEVVVHVDAALLSGAPPAGEARCELEAAGAPIAPETARRLSCDASVVAVVEDATGAPLSVGRRSRAIPAAIRRALDARDQGCVFPGCGATRFVEGHHIVHWAKGGETSLSNLCCLCFAHHHALHEGGYRIVVASPGQFRFLRPDGSEVGDQPRPEATYTPELGFPVDPADTLSRYRGGGLNLVEVIGALYGMDGRFAGVPRVVVEEAVKPAPVEEPPVENAWMYADDEERFELGPARYDWQDPPPALPSG